MNQIERHRPSPRLIGRLAFILVAGWSGAAAAEEKPGYFGQGEELISFEVDRPRPTRDKILIASLFGGAVLSGGVGLLFHLDSKEKSDEVSTASGRFSGRVYTSEVDDTRRSALRSRNATIVCYGIGGGLLVGTLVAYILTDPGRETIRVGVRPTLDTLDDGSGAVAGGVWTF